MVSRYACVFGMILGLFFLTFLVLCALSVLAWYQHAHGYLVFSPMILKTCIKDKDFRSQDISKTIFKHCQLIEHVEKIT